MIVVRPTTTTNTAHEYGHRVSTPSYMLRHPKTTRKTQDTKLRVTVFVATALMTCSILQYRVLEQVNEAQTNLVGTVSFDHFHPKPNNRNSIRISDDLRSGGSANATITVSSANLPRMKPAGGFVVFLHVPKTGGSTIRDTLMGTPGINYHFASGRKLFEQHHRQALRYLSLPITARKRDIFFFEVHGRDCPHLLEVEDILATYRRMARKRQLPIFMFTILREPISFALSYFNFFHVQRGSNPYFRQVEPTEANLLEYSLYNPQCQFLARGEFSLRNKTKQEPSPAECLRVKEVLLETMDWVGLTETLSDETVQLLKQVLGKATLQFRPTRISKKGNNVSVSLHELSPAALEELDQLSLLDHDLYNILRASFHFEMMSTVV